jgi:hypothetical protein
MPPKDDSIFSVESYEAVMAMVTDHTKAKARELAAELQDLTEDHKLQLFRKALEANEQDGDDGERVFKLFKAAWGRGHSDKKLNVRYQQWRLKKTSERRGLISKYSQTTAEDGAGKPDHLAHKFSRYDDFYQGDFYEPQIGHLYGYRGDFSDTSATLNEYGMYHFGRLLTVKYVNRVLSFTNELGNVIHFKYAPSERDVGAEELYEDAVSLRGQPILVTMKTSTVDGLLVDDEFFGWEADPKGVVGEIKRKSLLNLGRQTAGRINNKKLAARVLARKRDQSAHKTTPNWEWLYIGTLNTVKESKNAITLIGSNDMTRYFINKNASPEWNEIGNLAKKLEGAEVLLCLAQRGDAKTPLVIDVVSAEDPIAFLEERWEFSSEENARRRAAITAAEEEHKLQQESMRQSRLEVEVQFQEQIAILTNKAKQHRDAELQNLEQQAKATATQHKHELAEAKSRLAASVREQGDLVTEVALLQDKLRADAKKAASLPKPDNRSKARMLADFAGELKRAPKDATVHVRKEQQVWSAASQRRQDEEQAAASPTQTEDPKDLEIRLLKAELRAAEAEKTAALTETEKVKLKEDMTNLRLSTEQYRNMSEGERTDLITQLGDYHQEQWTDEERKAQKAAAAALAEDMKKKIGLSFPVNIPGKYCRNSFAMRTGKTLSKDAKVTIELKEHLFGNDYLVYIQEHMVETIACLQVDKRNKNHVAVVTFKNQRNGWLKAENEVKGGVAIKNTMSEDECLEIFEATQAKLDFIAL